MNIPVHETSAAITGATATGTLTVADSGQFYPGTNAWIFTTSGSAQMLVKILDTPTATTIVVRGYRNNDLNSPPSYGLTDVSAFAAGSMITMFTQTAPVNPAFAKRHVP